MSQKYKKKMYPLRENKNFFIKKKDNKKNENLLLFSLEYLKFKHGNTLMPLVIINHFFNLFDIDDPWYYFLYDILHLDPTKKWFFYKPHYLSFFPKLKDSKKWGYVRLIYKLYRSRYARTKKKLQHQINKNENVIINGIENFENLPIKNKENIKNILIYNEWKLKKKVIWDKRVTPYHSWRDQKITFKFQRYYLFYFAKNKNYYFWNKFRLQKFITKKIVGLDELMYNSKKFLYIFFNTFFNFNFLLKKLNILFLSKNNQIYYLLPVIKDLWIFSKEKKLILRLSVWNVIKQKFYYFKKAKKRIIFYIIEEKQKLTKKLIFIYIYIKFFEWAREWFVFEKLLPKRRIRRRKNELKIEKKEIIIIKKRKKRRTKNQMFLAFLRKVRLAHYLLWAVQNYQLYLNFKIKNNKELQIEYSFIFFDKTFICYTKELLINLDSLFAYFLPLRSYKTPIRVMSLLNDPVFNLWRNYYKKTDIVDPKIIQNVKLKDRVGNAKNFNKLNITNLYMQLTLDYNVVDSKNNNFYIQKKFNLIKHLLVYLRFFKKHKMLFKNMKFVFNVYFWLLIFFKGLNTSNLIAIKKILDYTTFFYLIQKLHKSRFMWFDLSDFIISLNILTFKNEVVKFHCNFTFLLQEGCLYIYSIFLNCKPKAYSNSFFKKIKDISSWKKINFIFKGYLSLEINMTVWLTLLKNNPNINSKNMSKNFLKVIQNFFNNCEFSTGFIKIYLKFYLMLLENIYNIFDDYVGLLLKNCNLQNDFVYIRYRNNILLGTTKSEGILLFLLTQFFFIFLYHFLKIYFFFLIILNFNNQKFEFLNYNIIKNENKKITIQPSFFSVIKLLFFLNVAKKNNKMVIIQPASYLFKLTCIQIFNYFINIWQEVYYYYYMIQNPKKKKKINLKKKDKLYIHLKKFNEILYKICFLTVYLKFQNRNKNLSYKFFKKTFKFSKFSEKELKIISSKNYKLVDNYIQKKTNLNLSLKYLANKIK